MGVYSWGNLGTKELGQPELNMQLWKLPTAWQRDFCAKAQQDLAKALDLKPQMLSATGWHKLLSLATFTGRELDELGVGTESMSQVRFAASTMVSSGKIKQAFANQKRFEVKIAHGQLQYRLKCNGEEKRKVQRRLEELVRELRKGEKLPQCRGVYSEYRGSQARFRSVSANWENHRLGGEELSL